MSKFRHDAKVAADAAEQKARDEADAIARQADLHRQRDETRRQMQAQASIAVKSEPLRPACRVCGSTSMPIRKAKGSVVVFAILFLLMIIPAIIYAIVFSGHVYVCPGCGAKVADAV